MDTKIKPITYKLFYEVVVRKLVLRDNNTHTHTHTHLFGKKADRQQIISGKNGHTLIAIN